MPPIEGKAFGDLALIVWDNVFARAVLGLLAANVVVGIAVSIMNGSFRLGETADFLRTRAIPYILGGMTVQIVLLTVPPQYSGLASGTGTAVWGLVILTLLGHILGSLAEIGIRIVPATPIAQTTAGTATSAGRERREYVWTGVPKLRIPVWLTDFRTPIVE